MKKIYLLFFLLSLLNLKAQTPTCGYDHTFIASGRAGIWPDSATNFVSGTVGQAYLQNVTIVIPKDTTVSGLGTLQYNHVDLQTNITTPVNYGLPPGLSLTGTPSTFKFPGNDSSCMVIYGTPTTAGSYTLSFTLKVYVVGSPIAITSYTVGYYIINIAAASGISTSKNYDFSVMQNNPNPVINNTTIKFTAPVDGKAKMSLYNIAGQKITEKEFAAQRGDNSYEFDAAALESGIYIYALELNGQKQIRRMVVAK
jgi:hypothetical protein